MRRGTPLAQLALFVLAVGLPLAVVVLLWASDLFSAWDGRVVSVRPIPPDARVATVLIVDADGEAFERRWPAPLVRKLGLRVDELAIAPSTVPSEAPVTRKSRFSLNYIVDTPDGFTAEPTTTPQSVALALVALILAVALRNMVVAGAPWAIEPRRAYLPVALAPSGQAAPTAQRGGARPRKGPPPPRPSVGRGRR